MRDESNIASNIVVAMIIAAIIFAVIVVLLTQSGLRLSQDGALISDNPTMESDCGAILSHAVSALSAERFEEAATMLAFVESLSCDEVYVKRAAELYGEIGANRRAIQLLHPLLMAEGTDVHVITAYTSNLLACGMRDSAAQILQTMLPRRIENGQHVRTLAWTALELALDDLAAALFANALEHDPSDADLWRALSQVTLRSGDPEGAERAAREALRLAPGSINAHVALAWAAEALSDTALAEQSFRNALAIDPHDQRTVFEFGRYHHRAGHISEALRLLRKGTNDPDCPYSWLMLRGRAELRAGRFEEARQTFLIADSKPHRDFHALLEIARIERRLRNFAQARKQALEALKEFPEQEEIREFLSTLPGNDY